ncbi:hypothetical protein ZHAS_00022144 [Anopheles sinensis]|uniref:Uncharacterized protein n=1 Tax=Anopheles sinensis TaxID=74873 RepID=A0A084WU68_ANOSI|nr:hypothetical protein ZHAS_00022144 [Anopheles sinensis]
MPPSVFCWRKLLKVDQYRFKIRLLSHTCSDVIRLEASYWSNVMSSTQETGARPGRKSIYGLSSVDRLGGNCGQRHNDPVHPVCAEGSSSSGVFGAH